MLDLRQLIPPRKSRNPMIENASAITQHRLDTAFLCGPFSLLSFCRHSKNRPQRACAYLDHTNTAIVKVLFNLKRDKTSDWACFFTIVEGEIENYGYGVEE